MNLESLLLVLFFLLPIINTLALSEKFVACKPKTCGNTQKISYPFYIENTQASYCGQPGFQLTCEKGFPMLNLFDNSYRVHEIDYESQRVRLSNKALTEPNCIPQVPSLRVGRYRFRVAPNQTDLLLLYGCNSTAFPERRIGCYEGKETRWVVALKFDEDEELGLARKNCKEGEANVTVEDVRGGVGDALKRGFWVLWNATNCNECETSGGRCGFDNDYLVYAFRCYCPDRPHALRCSSDRKGLSEVGKVAIGLSAALLSILMIGLLLYCKRKHSSSSDKFQTRSTYSTPSSPNPYTENTSVYFGVPLFSYKELAEATNRFDLNKQIGDGGFGTVYYGKLKDGREVAVKHLYNHNYRRVEQFLNEIQILTRLRHRNLVSLYGCTSQQSRELLLVYEYIPNGTVASHLHGELAKPGLLTWSLRIKIAVETAIALAYLHASKIIHRDVKTNNILLDNSFCVKVADFGLSRLFPNDMTHVSTAPQGTPGYVDPEYHQCYQLTSKSDVYSFGVVLIELISSMPAVDVNRHKDEINLSNLAIKKIQERALTDLVDPYLGFDSDNEVQRMIVEVAELAFQCLQHDRELRPSMDQVLEVLKRIECGKGEIEETHVHVSGVSHSNVQTSPELEETGLLKNRKPPSSPTSVTDSWESKSTTPNVSS